VYFAENSAHALEKAYSPKKQFENLKTSTSQLTCSYFHKTANHQTQKNFVYTRRLPAYRILGCVKMLLTTMWLHGGVIFLLACCSQHVNGNAIVDLFDGTEGLPPIPADITVGVYYYPWHGDDFHNRQYLRQYLEVEEGQIQHGPLLGEYDDTDPDVIAKHLRWSRQANVNLWLTSWWGKDRREDTTLKNVILPHEDLGDHKIALMYEANGRVRERNNWDLANVVSDMQYICKEYFEHPNYLKVDGKPVIVVYLSRKLYNNGVLAGVIKAMRDNCGREIFILGDQVWKQAPAQNTPYEPFSLLDGITNFDIYGNMGGAPYAGQDKVDEYYDEQKAWRERAWMDNVKYVPVASPGYNDRGVRFERNNTGLSRRLTADSPPGSLFVAELLQARYLVEPDFPILLVNSWNEWHEDTQIEPAIGDSTTKPLNMTGGLEYEGYGSLYLDILRKATKPTKIFDRPTYYEPFLTPAALNSAVDIYLNGEYADYESLTEDRGLIEDWDVSYIKNFANLFSVGRNPNARLFHGDLSRWNMDSAEYLHDMFLGASSFDADLSNWNVAKVKKFNGMFSGASSFKGTGLEKWDVSSGTHFMVMFAGTTSLELPDIGRWNVAKVVSTKAMFRDSSFGSNDRTNNLCAWAERLDSSVDTSFMFIRSSCPESTDPVLNNLPITDFCAPCKGTGEPFKSTEELRASVDVYLGNSDEQYADIIATYGRIEDWDVSYITNFGNLFNVDFNPNAQFFNADLSRWNMDSAEYLHDMFLGASSFDADLSNWNVAKVKKFNGMFNRASSFKGTGLEKWDVSSGMFFMVMFAGTDSLELPDISGWNIANAVNVAGRGMKSMFRGSNFGSDDSTNNLCAWADRLDSSVDTSFMFLGSNCPDTTDPNLTNNSNIAFSFCRTCPNSKNLELQTPSTSPSRSPSAGPSANPSSLEPTVACEDDPDWRFSNGRKMRDCTWVARRRRRRCSKPGYTDHRSAWEACVATCTNCQD
jgi:glycoprotein endo-alpha-1,2-mannosidase